MAAARCVCGVYTLVRPIAIGVALGSIRLQIRATRDHRDPARAARCLAGGAWWSRCLLPSVAIRDDEWNTSTSNRLPASAKGEEEILKIRSVLTLELDSLLEILPKR